MTEQVGDEGSGVGALGLLSGAFMGTGFPSITGGHAGPSNAEADSGSSVLFNNAFSVAGQGGKSSATATGGSEGLSPMMMLGIGALILLLVRKK